MIDPYVGREQTKAKHFILKRYLQALAFKVLNYYDITYVDGFSGPWETKTEDFSDTSFMIAISVLQDAQTRIWESKRRRRRVRCFFAEKNATAFNRLQVAVKQYHKPESGFEIETYCGKFEDAVDEIQAFVGESFALVFIDPKGWKGYPLPKIKPLFMRRRCEVLINFMYSFIDRFAHNPDQKTINSMAPFLGGPDWPKRLDPNLRPGLAVEKLFRETLKDTGDFESVVSTRIYKATGERPYFFVVYGTKSSEGLITFRQIEWDALRERLRDRGRAKERKREEETGVKDLFEGHEAQLAIDEDVEKQIELASSFVIKVLKNGPLPFIDVVVKLLQEHTLRKKNVKDICRDLAKSGIIENTWGGGNRKPRDNDMIKLKSGRIA